MTPYQSGHGLALIPAQRSSNGCLYSYMSKAIILIRPLAIDTYDMVPAG